MKVGIDIIEIDVFKKSLSEGGDSFINKNFSEREAGSPAESLAGKFAGKEALFKSGYTDSEDLRDFEVLNDENGAPYFVDRDGNMVDGISISIAHTDKTAVAVVINSN